MLERDSGHLGSSRAALGLLGGGLQPDSVTAAVRREGARVVHAHNVHPAFGWRALEAAREAGARVVLHLHNYRLVCAVGTCFTRGADCTRCHGRNTLPGVALRCRGSVPEGLVYGAALSLWQRRLVRSVDAFIVPSAFALGRLRELGAPLGDRAHVIPSVQRSFASESLAAVRALRPRRGPSVTREGIRRRDRGVPNRGRAARDRGRRAAARRAASARRRRALHRPRLRGRAHRPAPRRRGRRGPVAVRGDPAAGRSGGDGGGVARRRRPRGRPRRGRPVGRPLPAGRRRRLGRPHPALWRADAGERSLAAARARFAPSVVAAALRSVYTGH